MIFAIFIKNANADRKNTAGVLLILNYHFEVISEKRPSGTFALFHLELSSRSSAYTTTGAISLICISKSFILETVLPLNPSVMVVTSGTSC